MKFEHLSGVFRLMCSEKCARFLNKMWEISCIITKCIGWGEKDTYWHPLCAFFGPGHVYIYLERRDKYVWNRLILYTPIRVKSLLELTLSTTSWHGILLWWDYTLARCRVQFVLEVRKNYKNVVEIRYRRQVRAPWTKIVPANPVSIFILDNFQSGMYRGVNILSE